MVIVVKNLPANARDVRDVDLIPGLGRSPGGGMATHSSILAWRILWTEEPGGPWGCKELDTTEHTHTHKLLPTLILCPVERHEHLEGESNEGKAVARKRHS